MCRQTPDPSDAETFGPTALPSRSYVSNGRARVYTRVGRPLRANLGNALHMLSEINGIVEICQCPPHPQTKRR